MAILKFNLAKKPLAAKRELSIESAVGYWVSFRYGRYAAKWIVSEYAVIQAQSVRP